MRVPRLRGQLPWAEVLRSHSSALRPLIALVAVADVAAALYVWYLHGRGSRAGLHMALTALAPVRFLAAIALLGAALYLATRTKRAFQLVLMLVAVAGALLALLSSHLPLVAIGLADALAALLAGSLWRGVGDPLASRFGWILLAAAGVAAGSLLVLQHPDHRLAVVFALMLVTAFAAAAAALVLLDHSAPLPERRDPRAALSAFSTHAYSGVAPFALMLDKRHMWGRDGSSFLAYGLRLGVALALGPAIGPPDAAARLQKEFRRAARRRGWRPAFYQVPEGELARLKGMLSVPVGSEAVVDVDRFGLEGSHVANLRDSVGRARRAGVTVRIRPKDSLSPELRAAMNRLADRLRAGRRLGEMAFSVGRENDPADPERTVALGLDRSGQLIGYVTWLWMPATSTQVLDEVRRDSNAVAGTIELLIAASLESFRDRAARASLGMAPAVGRTRSGPPQPGRGAAPRLRGLLATHLPAAGLAPFKGKFAPTWEPRYLAVERLADLPAVLVALTLLHFPEIGQARPRGAEGRVSRLRRPWARRWA